MKQLFDVAVIGGGINGCGIAADAAMRGLSVILIEKDDLASKTSSSSSKLIHGGLRYLEYYDFSLVKKALDERQTLLDLAPHLVHPLLFVLPYQQALRPTWLLRMGLFLYDNLSRKNKLPKSKVIRRTAKSRYFLPLLSHFDKGFLFYDCSTDDARLTIANALQAKKHGAKICPQTTLVSAEILENSWYLTVKNQDGLSDIIKARTVINATGPWVEKINECLTIESHYHVSLVKGSHVVVPRLYEGNHAYLLQNEDKRIVFIVPYHGYTMIGTTDVVFTGNLEDVAINPDEIDYLFKLTQDYFSHRLTKGNIINSWSGVRPLLSTLTDSPQALSRDYTYEFVTTPAPAVCIYGGKITTYRQLARDAVNALQPVFPLLPASTTYKEILPGGDWNGISVPEYLEYAREHYHWLDADVLERLLQTYATRTEYILQDCNKMTDLGENFGHGLYQREIDYLCAEEWATSCDDILWRRTKLGLSFSAVEKQRLVGYLS